MKIFRKFLIFTLCILLISSVFLFSCGKNEDNVYIKYGDAKTLSNLLKEGVIDFALLPEPQATNVEKNLDKEGDYKRLSLQTLYGEKGYPQAVLMAKESVINENLSLVKAIKQKFNSSLSWIKNNVNLCVNAVKENYPNSTLNANIIDSEVIENCSIFWEDTNAKEDVKKYIDDILTINVGLSISPAKKIQDDFFADFEAIENAQPKVYNDLTSFSFVLPDGAPALSVSKFILDSENFFENLKFNYKVVDSESITGYMTGANVDNLKADFIILPVNGASKIYNSGNTVYKMVSSITHGNMFILSKTAKNGFNLIDLVGKKIGVIGEGKVPDLTLKYILEKNNLSYSVV